MYCTLSLLLRAPRPAEIAAPIPEKVALSIRDFSPGAVLKSLPFWLLYALFDRQGRSELWAWAQDNDRALGEWAALLHPREDRLAVVLPPAQVQMLHDHHLKREASA